MNKNQPGLSCCFSQCSTDESQHGTKTRGLSYQIEQLQACLSGVHAAPDQKLMSMAPLPEGYNSLEAVQIRPQQLG